MQTILTSKLIDARLEEAERRLSDPGRAPAPRTRLIRLPRVSLPGRARRALGSPRSA
jgi:hypothetical protein